MTAFTFRAVFARRKRDGFDPVRQQAHARTYGLVTWATSGNHRLAIGVTGLFFLAGLVLLRKVDVARGQAAAQG